MNLVYKYILMYKICGTHFGLGLAFVTKSFLCTKLNHQKKNTRVPFGDLNLSTAKSLEMFLLKGCMMIQALLGYRRHHLWLRLNLILEGDAQKKINKKMEDHQL